MEEKTDNQRLRDIRNELRLTQSELSDKLKIAQGSYSDVERGRKSISYQLLKKLVEILGVSSEWLITGNGNMFIANAHPNAHPNAHLIHEERPEYKKNSTFFERPAVVTVNPEGDPVIPIVDARAAAGLPALIKDPEYFAELPTIRLPFPMYRFGTWICIQVTGGSMRDVIQSMDYVICQQVTDNQKLKTGEVYVIVSQEGVICKRLKEKSINSILLSSDNTKYGDYSQPMNEVLQIWEARTIIKMDTESISPGPSLENIRERLLALEKAQ